MAYQKTDGTLQDAEYIVGRLRDGFSFDEAIQGMKMPIEPGTPDKPGWCYRNKELLMGFARDGMPRAPGLSSIARKPVTFLADKDGTMWAIYSDNTREEVKATVKAKEPVAEVREASPGIEMPEDTLTKVAKKSRKKLVSKEW